MTATSGTMTGFFGEAMKAIPEANQTNKTQVWFVNLYNTGAITTYYWYGIIVLKWGTSVYLYDFKKAGITDVKVNYSNGTLTGNSTSGATCTLVGQY